jgi:hypothetical protein
MEFDLNFGIWSEFDGIFSEISAYSEGGDVCSK